jgi:hypothetical protein
MPITGRGIGYVKAPRRQIINLFGKFTIYPSPVERVVKAGQSYNESGNMPYIDVVDPYFETKKIPNEVTTVMVRMPDGVHYFLHQPIIMSVVGERTIRFEGVACEEIKL